MRRFLRNYDGATSIEYAIIAGLIGLGLVGSLVTTRGSLSAIFGVTATQMGSSDAGSAAPAQGAGLNLNPGNPRTPYWAGKTVASGPAYSSSPSTETWTTSFTDGSSSSYTVYKNIQLVVQRTFEANTLWTIETSYWDGQLSSVTSMQWTSIAQTNATYGYTSSDFYPSGAPRTMSSGNCYGQTCSLPDKTYKLFFTTQVSNGINDFALWAAQTPRP